LRPPQKTGGCKYFGEIQRKNGETLSRCVPRLALAVLPKVTPPVLKVCSMSALLFFTNTRIKMIVIVDDGDRRDHLCDVSFGGF